MKELAVFGTPEVRAGRVVPAVCLPHSRSTCLSGAVPIGERSFESCPPKVARKGTYLTIWSKPLITGGSLPRRHLGPGRANP